MVRAHRIGSDISGITNPITSKFKFDTGFLWLGIVVECYKCLAINIRDKWLDKQNSAYDGLSIIKY